jgi:hypothetical protein
MGAVFKASAAAIWMLPSAPQRRKANTSFTVDDIAGFCGELKDYRPFAGGDHDGFKRALAEPQTPSHRRKSCRHNSIAKSG